MQSGTDTQSGPANGTITTKGGTDMMKAPQLHIPTPKVGAHLTHLLQPYRARGMVKASQEQERRRVSWKALIRARRA
jgi:hypothetical protein